MMRVLLVTLGLLALAACHARWNPWSARPSCDSFRPQPQDEGVFGREYQGELTDEECGYASAVRYSVQQDGTLTVAARASGRKQQLVLSVFTDGNTPIASTAETHLSTLTLPVQAGDLYIVVSESWRDAIKLKFDLRATFAPATN